MPCPLVKMHGMTSLGLNDMFQNRGPAPVLGYAGDPSPLGGSTCVDLLRNGSLQGRRLFDFFLAQGRQLCFSEGVVEM